MAWRRRYAAFEECGRGICTLTLCSVLDPGAGGGGVRRVLKPGAPFMFIEHCLARTTLTWRSCSWV